MWLAVALNVITYVFLVLVIKRVFGSGRLVERERTFNSTRGTELPKSAAGPGRQERIKASQMFLYVVLAVLLITTPSTILML